MATYVINATPTTGGWGTEFAIRSNDGTWTTARAGADLIVQTSSTSYTFVNTWSGTRYYTGQILLHYDTSVLGSSAKIKEATVSVYVNTPTLENKTVTLRLRRRDSGWTGPDVTTGNWVAGANLTSHTLMGSISFSTTLRYYSRLENPQTINKTAVTRVLVHDARQESTSTSGMPSTSDLFGSGSFRGTTWVPLYVFTEDNHTMAGIIDAMVQLSDGSTAYLESNAANPSTVVLKRVRVDETVDTLGTIITDHSETQGIKITGTQSDIVLVRNSNDDIFVIGARGNATNRIGRVSFEKTGTNTWSGPSGIASTTSPGIELPANFSATFVNSAANSGQGRILITCLSKVDRRTAFLLIDANLEGALIVRSSALNPAWMPGGTANSPPMSTDFGTQVETDVFGGDRVLVGSQASLGTWNIFRVVINSSGTISSATALPESPFGCVNNTRLKILGKGSDSWAFLRVISDFFAGNTVRVTHVSGATLGTASNLSTVLPSPSWFDAIRDDFTGAVYAYSWKGTDNTILRRNNTDVRTFTGSGVRGPIRLPKRMFDSEYLEIHHNRTDGSTHTFVRARGEENVAPNAPILTSKIGMVGTEVERFEWTFSDSNVGDRQTAFELQIRRVSDSTVMHDTGIVVSEDMFYDLAATTLVNGVEHQWRVRTRDLSNEWGPFSNWSANFMVLARPVGVITEPADEGFLTTSTFNVEWNYSQTNSVPQSRYRVRLLEGASVIRDSGWVTSEGARAYELDGILSGEYIVELQVEALTVTSAIYTIDITVSVQVQEETENKDWVYWDPDGGFNNTPAFVMVVGETYPDQYSIVPFDDGFTWETVPSAPNLFEARREVEVDVGGSVILTIEAKRETTEEVGWPFSDFRIFLEYEDGTEDESDPIDIYLAVNPGNPNSGVFLGDGFSRWTRQIVAEKPVVAVRVRGHIWLLGLPNDYRFYLSQFAVETSGKIVSQQFIDTQGAQGLLVSGSGRIQLSEILFAGNSGKSRVFTETGEDVTVDSLLVVTKGLFSVDENFFINRLTISSDTYNNHLRLERLGNQDAEFTLSSATHDGFSPGSQGVRLLQDGTINMTIGPDGLWSRGGFVTPSSVTSVGFQKVDENGSQANPAFRVGGGVNNAGMYYTGTGSIDSGPGPFFTAGGNWSFGVGTDGVVVRSGRHFSVGSYTWGSANTSAGFTVNASNGSGWFARNGIGLYVQRFSNGDIQRFYNSATISGTISVSGSSTTYGTSSDYRLKENLAPIEAPLVTLGKLNPITFDWKDNPEAGRTQGFLAHEVAEVVPQAVSGEKDAVQDDGKIEPQSVDHSHLVPLLVAAVQDLVNQVDALQERLDSFG